jgi:hypothetical protein
LLARELPGDRAWSAQELQDEVHLLVGGEDGEELQPPGDGQIALKRPAVVVERVAVDELPSVADRTLVEPGFPPLIDPAQAQQ